MFIKKIDVSDIKKELEIFLQKDWWDSKRRNLSSQRFSDGILIKNRLPGQLSSNIDGSYSNWTKASEYFPNTKKLIVDLEKELDGNMGRVVFVSLEKKGQVFLHHDSEKWLEGFWKISCSGGFCWK